MTLCPSSSRASSVPRTPSPSDIGEEEEEADEAETGEQGEEDEGERWVEGALGEEVADEEHGGQTTVDDELVEDGEDDGILKAQPPPWLRIKREVMVGMDMDDD